jgi:hypothetical protein
MNFTQSPDRAIHPGTGNALHTDSAPLTTVLTAQDINQLIWSLMRVLADAGVSAANFNPADPNTYNRVSLAIQALGTPLSAFTGANQSLAANGWQKLPGGLILQWGTYTPDIVATTVTEAQVSLTFPLAYPNACFGVLTQILNAGLDGVADTHLSLVSKSTTGFTVSTQWPGNGDPVVHGFNYLTLGR